MASHNPFPFWMQIVISEKLLRMEDASGTKMSKNKKFAMEYSKIDRKNKTDVNKIGNSMVVPSDLGFPLMNINCELFLCVEFYKCIF